MTADTIADTIADTLAEALPVHEHRAVYNDCSCCEFWRNREIELRDWYRVHLAAALVPVVAAQVEAARAEADSKWLRTRRALEEAVRERDEARGQVAAARAAAWDEGREAGVTDEQQAHRRWTPTPNPYRADALDQGDDTTSKEAP